MASNFNKLTPTRTCATAPNILSFDAVACINKMQHNTRRLIVACSWGFKGGSIGHRVGIVFKLALLKTARIRFQPPYAKQQPPLLFLSFNLQLPQPPAIRGGNNGGCCQRICFGFTVYALWYMALALALDVSACPASCSCFPAPAAAASPCVTY